MDLTTVLIGGLVTWRLARLISKENGPLLIFARFRAYLANKQQRLGGFYDMVSCVACMSMYIGLWAAIWPAGTVLELIGYTIAFSAVATLIERYSEVK